MNFNIGLKLLMDLEKIEIPVHYKKIYSEELDDERSVIEDICEIFEETKKIKFFVSGFDKKEWYVDCRTDLAIIIEQIPDIISRIRNNNYLFELDFYEQGVEKKIYFIPNKDGVSLKCLGKGKWITGNKNIVIEEKKVAEMFERLFKDFLICGKYLCIDLINQNLFRTWIEHTLNSSVNNEMLR